MTQCAACKHSDTFSNKVIKLGGIHICEDCVKLANFTLREMDEAERFKGMEKAFGRMLDREDIPIEGNETPITSTDLEITIDLQVD